MTSTTPMVSQYKEIKAKYTDAILFFRLGDFYEMFYEDAEVGSRELGLTLTGRGQEENRMPMCGIPYHAAQTYIAKLLQKGYKVAICEQVEDLPAGRQIPSLAKGLVKRDVIKVYTPGTVIESSYVSEKTNNYLMFVSFDKNMFGIAFADVSTGEFRITEIISQEKLWDEINRINPKEILFSDMWAKNFPQTIAFKVNKFKDKYDPPEAQEKLLSFFKVKSIESFGINDFTIGLSAAASMLDYIEENQKTSLGHINKILPYSTDDYLIIDSQTRRNLELVQTIKDKSHHGSLLSILDKCKTNMGSRLLRNWLLMPLVDIDGINQRLDAVEELKSNPMLRAQISEKLKNVFDIERLTAKIASKSANAKDLIALKESVGELPALKEIMKNTSSKLLKAIKDLPDLAHVSEIIEKSILENPPFVLKEGGLIKDNYDEKLDELRSIGRGGKSWIAELENKERQRTGIKSLKVGFNKVFGYYIEVTTSNLEQVPADYIRKQTLINCERFITPELKDKEALVLNADERSNELEYEIFCKVRDEIGNFIIGLQIVAHTLAMLDSLVSLAEVSESNNYCRPELTNSPKISIKGSRHPVVEKNIGEHNFVPNDIMLDQENSFVILTGPNMAGKSTYMRQAALAVILAQMGSFIPASAASISITDRIFTRIGAMDDIYSGQSTFMVEMTETANILNNATDRSLIILDEIGRGTATFDGMSIAAAVVEYIHTKIKAKTMFATHYHEITQLADKFPSIINLNVTAIEVGDSITFLHKINKGPADKSYGIQVARLAGLPHEVIKKAKEIYETLEMVENDLGKTKAPKKILLKVKSKQQDQSQASLF